MKVTIKRNMPSLMTPERIKSIFPNASKSTIEANADSKAPDTKPERGVRSGPLAKKKGKTGNSRKCLVSITSYRVRRVDPDNLCGKWHLDALRFAKIIHDDTEDDIVYQICQKKVAHKKEEKTLIEVSVI